MIGKIVKKILRAAVAQPWDYMGEGAPGEWEFRVSPEEDTLAVYNPNYGKWVLFRQVITLAEVASLSEMDRNTADWYRYVEELEDE